MVGVINVILIATGSIDYIASVSLISLAICYMIGCLAYLGLKRKYGYIKRPYVAPFGNLGCFVTIVVYSFMLIFADRIALITAGIISAMCLLFYYVFTRKHASKLVSLDEEIGNIEEPSLDEKIKMNKAFNNWKISTIFITIIALGIYFVPMIF